MFSAKNREPFMAALAALNPNPKSELNYSTPFELLVAVMLSAQATDKGVNLATAKLFPVANTPQKILDLGLDGLIPYVQTINLYRTKAQHLIEACRILIDRFHGEVPRTRDELVSLPGVGRKTANVLGAVLWQKEVMPVDTHVFRVSERIGLTTRSKTPLQTELTLEKNIPGHLLPLAHHWLILHGRYVCVARAPKCDECGIATWCRKYASDHRQPKTLKI